MYLGTALRNGNESIMNRMEKINFVNAYYLVRKLFFTFRKT